MRANGAPNRTRWRPRFTENERSHPMCSIRRTTRIARGQGQASVQPGQHADRHSQAKRSPGGPRCASRVVPVCRLVSPVPARHDERERTCGEDHAGHRIRVDERAVEDDRNSERDDGPAKPGGPGIPGQEVSGFPDESGADGGTPRNPHDDRPIASEGERGRDERGETRRMHGVLLAVDARSCSVRTKEPAVVRQVVAACVVVLNRHVMVEQQALGNHQVVRLVAIGWQRLSRPHRKKDDERDASRHERRRARIADQGEPSQGPGRQAHDNESERDRTPHEEDRGSGPHEKQIGHAQRNPGQCDQKRQEQRETGSRGHTRRRRDDDRAHHEQRQQPRRREDADSPRAVRVGDRQ